MKRKNLDASFGLMIERETDDVYSIFHPAEQTNQNEDAILGKSAHKGKTEMNR